MAEIEAGQALVNANRELITRFETKIQATLTRIWGEVTVWQIPGVSSMGTCGITLWNRH